MKQLNVETFTYMPRATEHIEEQIALIQNLEAK
jgi:cysteinyl-tRNA synthetase